MSFDSSTLGTTLNEISFVLEAILASPEVFEEIADPFQDGRAPYEIADGEIITVPLRYWRGEVLEFGDEKFVVEPLPPQFFQATPS